MNGKDLKEKEQTALQLEQGLKEKLTGKEYKYLIADFFHVDSKGGIRGDSETFKKLKHCLMKCISNCPNWEEKRPIRYMQLLGRLYEQEEKPGQAIIELKQVEQFAKEYDMDLVDDVKTFLRFHHATGDLTYFPTMEDFVILNAQWLIDVFTQLITIQHYYSQKQNVDQVELERLRNEALICKESSLFCDSWKMFIDEKTGIDSKKIEFLKQLMCRFYLMIPVDDDYLCPSLLKQQATVINQLGTAWNSNMIYLKFHTSLKNHAYFKKGRETYDNFLPPSLFPQLICRLARVWIPVPGEQYRNLFSFIIKDEQITLATNSTWIGISLTHAVKKNVAMHLQEICNHLDVLLKEYYTNMWFEFCINPCKGQENTSEQCITSTGVSSITGKQTARRAFCKYHRSSSMLTKDYEFWFGKQISRIISTPPEH